VGRPLGIEKAPHGSLVLEIELLVRPEDEIAIAFGLERADDCRTNEPAMPRDKDFGRRIHAIPAAIAV
jgi:hypothetical protein